MISEEEYLIKKKKLMDLSDKKEDLIKQIETQKDLSGQIEPLKRQIELLKKDISVMEQQYSKEMNQIQGEIRSIKALESTGLEFTKNLKLKVFDKTLSVSQDKLAKMNETLSTLESQNLRNEQIEQPIDKSQKLLEEKIKKMNKIKSKVPNGKLIALQMSDLISTYHNLSQENTKQKIRQKEISFKELQNKIELQRSELESLNQEFDVCQSLNLSLSHNITFLFSQLQQLSTNLENANRSISNQASEAVLQSRQGINSINDEQSELNLLRHQLEHMHNDDEFQSKFEQNIQTDLKVKIQKQNILEMELQKKIDKIRDEIRSKREQEPAFIENTKNLELKWLEHEAALTELIKMEKLHERRKDDILRKDQALIYLRELFPPDNDQMMGMDRLNSLYNVALKENRKMAETMDELHRNIESLEHDNASLLQSFNQ